MTAAQKTAQANFKKAIAYRKKTGCSLKQAFAHVKGGKVTGLDKVVKKGSKTTVLYSKKTTTKKAAPKKKTTQGKLFGLGFSDFENKDVRITRVNNDVYGNPRYAVHYFEFLNDEENKFLPWNKDYEYALKKAKKIGGKKFHNKQFGGGIVFQTYDPHGLIKKIIALKHTTPKIKI